MEALAEAFFFLARLALRFPTFISEWGFGGVFNSRSKTSSSREEALDKYESPLGLDNEYYRLLGIIAAHWERLEFVLEIAVAEVGSHDPHSVALLTANIGYQAKMDLVMAYARTIQEHDEAGWKAICAALENVKAAYVLRNTYVHARWVKSPKPGELPERSIVRTRGGKLNIKNASTTTEELVDAAKRIEAAHADFIRTFQTFGLLMFETEKPVP